MSDKRVAVPYHTAPLKWGRNSAKRRIHTAANVRKARSSAGWVSAQNSAMYSRTAFEPSGSRT